MVFKFYLDKDICVKLDNQTPTSLKILFIHYRFIFSEQKYTFFSIRNEILMKKL